MTISNLRKRSEPSGVSVALLLFIIPMSAWANVGPPSSGGHLVADLAGSLEVAITREKLTIDMRPVASGKPARVEALYQLHNDGEAREFELLFASGSSFVNDFQISLGDQSIDCVPAPKAELPESWKAPTHTPALDGIRLDYLRYRHKQITPMRFTVAIPPGKHVLKMSYQAETAIHQYGHPHVYRQFAYVLAPARSWAEFGGLDVVIQLPETWRAACSLPLSREGDTLTGSFDALPAGAISLTLQAPEGSLYRPLAYAGLGLLALTGIGGAVVCGRGGRAAGRSDGSAWPAAILWPAAWGLAVFAAGMFAIFGPDLALSSAQASHYGYGRAFAMIGVVFLAGLAMAVGFIITLSAAAVFRRRETAGK